MISDSVQKELQIGEILDFTLVESHEHLHLVCLLKHRLLFFDCKHLLNNFGSNDPADSRARYTDSIELNDSEAVKIYAPLKNDGQIIVSSATRLTLIAFDTWVSSLTAQFALEPPEQDQDCPVQDVNIHGTQAFVCYQSKNKGCTFVVYDLNSNAPEGPSVAFRALYADCDKVLQIHYVPPPS